MKKNISSKLGNIGESIACDFLIKNGFEVVITNYHSRYGEVDIIAKKKETYIFVEVKTRSKINFFDTLEQIPKSKFEKIYKTALVYLQENNILNCDLESILLPCTKKVIVFL